MKRLLSDAGGSPQTAPCQGESPHLALRTMEMRDFSGLSTNAHCTMLAEPKRLRVLHVVSCLGVGGTEYGVLKLMKGLSSETFDQRLCAVRGISTGFVCSSEMEGRLFIAGRPVPGFQLAVFRLARIMEVFRPHIVHSRNWGALEAVPAARLAKVPVVIHSEHGYELENLSGLPYRHRLFRRAVYPMADAVFAVTSELRNYHARQAWIAERRLRVIYNGVDTDRFAPRPESHVSLRQELGLPDNSFVLGTVGRVVPIKDITTLLSAAEVLINRGVNVRVLLVGSGPELNGLQRHANASPSLGTRVVFTGVSDRVPELLNAMDAFVLTSRGEGMSNTLLEAMASGLPVVATRVGGNPEVVEEDRSGWLIAPGDVNDLAGKLEQLAGDQDLRYRLGAEARDRAVAVFSLRRMLDNYRDLYLEHATRCGDRAVEPGHVRN